jgi:hypothetical protein
MYSVVVSILANVLTGFKSVSTPILVNWSYQNAFAAVFGYTLNEVGGSAAK